MSRSLQQTPTIDLNEGVPESFYCPILFTLMEDPVLLTVDGNTYERTAIASLEIKKSPLNRAAFDPTKDLIANRTLKKVMEEYFASPLYKILRKENIEKYLQSQIEKNKTNDQPTADDWNTLGVCHTDNPENAEISHHCFLKAIALDPQNSIANQNLCRHFLFGFGVEKNLVVAKEHLKLLDLNEESVVLLALEFEIAEIQKDKPITADAWNNLGSKYHKGTDEKPRDYKKAKICYEEALKIDVDHVYANYNLGLLYRYGSAVTKDLVKAKKHFQKSADKDEDAILCLLEIEVEEIQKDKPITADAWNDLGVKYHNGTDGKTRDYKKAKICYEEALKNDADHVYANCNLGLLYQYGRGITKDFVKSKEYFQKSADKNHESSILHLLEIEVEEIQKDKPITADAWNNLGVKYHNGTEENTRDYKKAKLCYEQALRLDVNHIHANSNLGIFYKNGHDVQKNLDKAKEYLKKSADKNFEPAIFYLLQIEFAETQNETPTADEWWYLGVQYDRGECGKTIDYKKANICYKKALEINPDHYNSNYRLGLNYQYGCGIAKDLALARQYFQKAADKNHELAIFFLLQIEIAEIQKDKPITADAWCDLGVQYDRGECGKTIDDKKANICYKKALEINPDHDDSNYRLGVNYLYGYGITKDLALARQYFQKAADKNHELAIFFLLQIEIAEIQKDKSITADAWNNLGEKYHNGTDGKTCDYKKAKICYEEALKIDADHVHANYYLGILYRYGRGVTKDLRKAKEYFQNLADKDEDVILSLLQIEVEEIQKDKPITADAWNNLGRKYHDGADGKTRDYKKANICHKEALKLELLVIVSNREEQLGRNTNNTGLADDHKHRVAHAALKLITETEESKHEFKSQAAAFCGTLIHNPGYAQFYIGTSKTLNAVQRLVRLYPAVREAMLKKQNELSQMAGPVKSISVFSLFNGSAQSSKQLEALRLALVGSDESTKSDGEAKQNAISSAPVAQ